MKVPDIPCFFNIAKVASFARRQRGQTSLEYLLLLAVVAVIVIASFSPGSLIQQVHDSAQGYYNTVTSVIMGNGNYTFDGRHITPIDGGWCPVTCPSSGSAGPTVMYAACECPAPAFGGAYCSANGAVVDCAAQGVIPCGPCPTTGQVCLPPDGHCGCANNIDCSSIPNSSPDPSCTKCACNNGTYWDAPTKSCKYCASTNGQCTTSTDGITCTPIPSCPTNMNCNTVTNSCQCNQYTYYVGPGCAYCPQCQRSYDAKTCVDASTTICPSPGNWFCSTTAPSDQLCQCWTNYCFIGGACVWTGHSCP